MTIIVDYLAHHPQFIPEVSELVYGQWPDLFASAGIGKAQLLEKFEERANTSRLPITMVAIDQAELVGTGSIKLYEESTRSGLSPWLAGMYIKPQHRKRGVGALLVQALEAKARELGTATLYLSVGDAVNFYESLGWRVIDAHIASPGARPVTLMSKQL